MITDMSPLNYIERRNKLRRKVLPGFPGQGKFQTKQKIDDYFSGDRLQCLLCGKWFQRLPTHLDMIHGIGVDEYREMYGLPWKRGLCGEELSGKLSAAMKKRHENGFRPDLRHCKKKIEAGNKKRRPTFFYKSQI